MNLVQSIAKFLGLNSSRPQDHLAPDPDTMANNQLVDLSDEMRLWEADYDHLSHAERVYKVIYQLEADVNNGGFHQYYFNSAGDGAFAIVDALNEIGAHRCAEIVKEANRCFPGTVPPREREERQALLEQFDAAKLERLETLDVQFFEYPDNLTRLLYDYVALNRETVPGAMKLGFSLPDDL